MNAPTLQGVIRDQDTKQNLQRIMEFLRFLRRRGEATGGTFEPMTNTASFALAAGGLYGINATTGAIGEATAASATYLRAAWAVQEQVPSGGQFVPVLQNQVASLIWDETGTFTNASSRFLYLSPTLATAVTPTAPTSPNRRQIVGLWREQPDSNGFVKTLVNIGPVSTV